MSGQLFDKMLDKCLSLNRERVYVTNIVKCRPPNNRDPNADEISACFGYLQQQIILVQPKVIVTLGRFATQTLLETTRSISKLRGSVYQFDGIPVVPTWHPAYLLRKPSARWGSAADMDTVDKLLRNKPLRGLTMFVDEV